MQEDANLLAIDTDKTYRRVLRGLFVKVSLYYILLGSSVALLLYLVPGLVTYLPVGGLSGIPSGAADSVNSFDLTIRVSLTTKTGWWTGHVLLWRCCARSD